MTIEELFTKCVTVLTMSSPYAFHMLMRTFAQPDKNVETACVYTRDGKFFLKYNPSFMKKYKTPGRSFILCHECLHILLHHCSGYRGSSDPREKILENIAMDLAVNSLIPVDDKILLDYPRPILEDGSLGKPELLLPEQYGFDKYLSFEQYKDLLEEYYKGKGMLEILKSISELLNGKECFDDHSKFEEDKTAEAEIRSLFTNTLERNQMFGKMSATSINCIRAAQTRQVPWHRLVRAEIGRIVVWSKTPTRRKFHKYYGAPFPGWDFKSVEPIACYLDLSGSMSDQQKSLLVGELLRLTDVAPVFLWGFDCYVNNPDKFRYFRKNDFMKPVVIEGGGGTSFTPIFEHAISKKIKNVIVLTDGYAEQVTIPLPRLMNVIWVINNKSDNSSVPRQPGKMLFIK